VQQLAEEPRRWVTLSTRPSRHAVVCSNAACSSSRAEQSSICQHRVTAASGVWKWKGEGTMGVHGYRHGTREHMQEIHLARRYSMCRPTTVYRLYSLLLYGSSAILTSVTLLLLRHRIFDAAECQHSMGSIRTDADDTLADSIYE
jgi:hypothetical protein